MSDANMNLVCLSMEFSILCFKISTLTKTSRRLRNDNSEPLYNALQSTVQSIQCTWTVLQDSKPLLDKSSTSNDENDDSFLLEDEDSDSKLTVLQTSVTDLTQSINVLTAQTKEGLAEAADLKQQSVELYTSAQALNQKLEDAKTEMEGELSVKREDLNRAIRLYNARVEEYNKALIELEELEEELEDKKDNRAALRVGRVAMWGTSLFLPGMAVVAAGMEIAAKKLRDNISATKSRKYTCESNMGSAESSMNTFKSQVAELDRVVSRASALVDDCESQVYSSEYAMRRTKDLADRLTDIDKAASHLAMKMGGLRDRTEMMEFVRDDGRALRVAVGEFMDEISKAGQSDLVGICEPLMMLLK
ncbi:hypothetical protein BKA61DRAFT_679816 [Leptodontidium sp. MPI-SDFR-AT-0119]|nr:hypothetical protein BKA61DRAFT_679816 [Leptodontidium sp. MPI-SDFR-AT-0119]